MLLYIGSLYIVLFISFFMTLLVGGRMTVRGAVPLVHLLSGMCVWTFCQLLHIFSVSMAAKYFWYQAKFAGIVLIPAAFLMITAEITEQKWRIRQWHHGVIMAISIITLLAAATDPWFHLFRTELSLVDAGAYTLIKSSDGPFFWLFTVYTYCAMFYSVYLLWRQARRTQGEQRQQALYMIAGSVFPWVWNVVFLLILQLEWPLDLTPVLMLVTEFTFIITLFRYRLLNIVPFSKRAVYDQLKDLILVVDLEGVIQDMNPTALKVMPAGSKHSGTKVSVFFSSLTPIYEGLTADLRGEFRIPRGGKQKAYSASATAIVGNRKNTVGHLLYYRDVTESLFSRKSLEEATRELDIQNRKKELFMKQVNRNIRMPMNRILGYADVLSGELLTAEQEEALEHLTVSGTHLLKLINDITDYSRIEAGNMKVVEEPVQVFDIVRHVCKLFEYPAQQKGLRIEYAIDSDVPITVLTDPMKLTQIISNIMGNAIKFTEYGHVKLELKRTEPQMLQIEISDTGAGISPEDLSRIFTPYHQAGAGKNQAFAGTGLGLAIVNDLVERMGGTVKVYSVPGNGSTFSVVLPCKPGEIKSAVYDIGQVMDYKKRPMEIGLVTKDPVLQALIPRYLKSWPKATCRIYSSGSDVKPHLEQLDIVFAALDEEGEESREFWLPRRDAGASSPLAVVGLTTDTEVYQKERNGRGALMDCLLLPVVSKDINKMLRAQILNRM